MKKLRVDILLLSKGLCSTREEAKKLILAGKVRIGKDQLVHKSSQLIPEDTELIIEKTQDYVSRGAYKLLPAIEKYPPKKIPFIAADIGASTGGFCEVLLQFGAKKIYAVDAGRGQLHPKLKVKPEIISMEKTNARYLTAEQIPEKLDIVTIDVSFISVRKILPALIPLINKNARIYMLFKPQFELGRKFIEKGGVVKNKDEIKKEINSFANFAESFGLKLLDIIPSPIKGPKGNQEEMMIFDNCS